MKKPTRKHVQAVSRGKLFLNKAFSTNPEPRFKLAIEKDMELLDEVEKMLLDIMYNVDLPFGVKTPSDKEHDDI